MPISEEKFSKPPSGDELSAEDVKNLMSGPPQEGKQAAPDIEKVAKALGGTVTSAMPVVASDGRKESDVEDAAKRKAMVDEDDRKEYLRTLLAGQSFVKRYPIYGGNVHVTFKTRTVVENDEVDVECASPTLSELIKSKTLPVIKERLRMGKTVIELFVGDRAVKMPLTLGTIADMDEVLFSAVRTAYREFEELCDILFEMANDPDFWNQTVGAT